MNLKFKRNLPIILLLVGILSLLAVGMGDQRVVAYSIPTESLPTEVATFFAATPALEGTSTAFTTRLNSFAEAFGTLFQSGKMTYSSQ